MDNFLNSVATDFKTVWKNTDFANGVYNTDMAKGAGLGANSQQENAGQNINEQTSLPVNRNVNFQGRRLLIEKLLGEGGFAFVYQVVDNNTGQRFALKKMMTQNKSNEIVQLIQNEVKLWKQINNHRNIITIHGVEQAHDSIMILADLCTGGTLFDLIMKYDGKMQEQQIIHILIDICSGLQHMHRQGIQHRDIKVENILLDQQNKAFRLCDFGSASKSVLEHGQGASPQYIEDQFEYYEKYTTMMYRPPEMIDKYMKFRVDTQVDVWMLGCVIFSLCFNYHPYQDCGKIGILNAQYFMPVNDAEVDRRISQKMKDLIHIILVPNPKDRPTIDQILEILKNWQNIPRIKLTAVADQIRIKNLGGDNKVPSGPKKKVGDLTYDDMAKLQQRIKDEQDRKQKKKQHIPLNQNASLQFGNQQQRSDYRPQQNYRQPQMQKHNSQMNQSKQDNMFNFDASNQPKTFNFDAVGQQQASNNNQTTNDFFDFGGMSNQSQSNSHKSNGRVSMGPNLGSHQNQQVPVKGEIENANLLDFYEEPPKKPPGSLLEEMADMSGFTNQPLQDQQQNKAADQVKPPNSQAPPQQQQSLDGFFNFDVGAGMSNSAGAANSGAGFAPSSSFGLDQQPKPPQQQEQKIEDFFKF